MKNYLPSNSLYTCKSNEVNKVLHLAMVIANSPSISMKVKHPVKYLC